MKSLALLAALLFCCALVPRASGQITPSPTWRNTIAAQSDPFTVFPWNPPGPAWVKFTILLNFPDRAYFQNSNTYTFHHDFARERLDPYLNITREQFDAITLSAAGQQMALGAVLFPPATHPNAGQEFAVQLVRRDPYTREQARDFINLIRSKVTGAGGMQVLYLPTFEQAASAQAQAAWFATQGITVVSAGRWATGDESYAHGWALGRLRFVTASQIDAAYTSGSLRPDDILLTDAVPAEVPFLAGVVSLSPSTPNSHVAILSQTYGTPFAFIAEGHEEAMALDGQRVLLRAYSPFDRTRVSLTPVPVTVTPDEWTQMLALKVPAPLVYQPMASMGRFMADVDTLLPQDIRFVGGKAANYGSLRRALPGDAIVRPAAALTFDAWNTYLNQTLTTGRTLRAEIHARLDHHTWPPNIAALKTDLAAVRALFTNTAQTAFPAALQSAILAGLQDPNYGFNPDVKIRFRSSTNVEDSDTFTGAGLYDSFSGCLRDDLDQDTIGPSACDASEANERGVLRAIRRVYASFYNDNAFIQRLRLGVNEDQVGMGILIHHSFPDPLEMANGVAVLRWTGSSAEVSIVSQLGAVSVTNPTDGSIPEEVTVYINSFGTYCERRRNSNLVQLGGTVMAWESDYALLATRLKTAADRFVQEAGLTAPCTLDFEFKKVAPLGTLEIKQIRRVPAPVTSPTIVPWMLGAPTDLCLFQGEAGDVFANHRLKTRLRATPDTRRLDGAGRASNFYTHWSYPFHNGCEADLLEGNPGGFLNALYSYSSNAGVNQWGIVGIPNPRSLALVTAPLPDLVAPSQSPILTVDDLGAAGRQRYELRATYRYPVTAMDWSNQVITRTQEIAFLCPCDELKRGPRRHYVTGNQQVTIDTAFYYTPMVTGIVAGYTADLAAWDRTIITGLTSEPIVLRSEWSQTFRPGHHNFTEEFIFDPRLEPGIPARQLAELQRAGVAYLHVRVGTSEENPVRIFADPGCPLPCSADFDNDGDVGTDADIAAFFACLAGNCCATCADADVDNDGDVGTDADIAAFFRVLAGGSC